MPITDDDQIDYERVIAEPEYRRVVIVYLNAQARRMDRWRSPHTAALRGGGIGFHAPQRHERSENQLRRRFG